MWPSRKEQTTEIAISSSQVGAEKNEQVDHKRSSQPYNILYDTAMGDTLLCIHDETCRKSNSKKKHTVKYALCEQWPANAGSLTVVFHSSILCEDGGSYVYEGKEHKRNFYWVPLNSAFRFYSECFQVLLWRIIPVSGQENTKINFKIT